MSTYIITATDKKPDTETGIVTIRTFNSLKKLYLVSCSIRGDATPLGIASAIMNEPKNAHNL